MRAFWMRAVCMALLLLPSLTSAQAGPAGTQARYRDLIQKALQEYSAGNWPEAKVYFSDAHAISPNARTFRGLGMTCYEARSYVEAIRYLEQALTNKIQPLTPQLEQEARHVLEQARRFVTTLKLEVLPKDATVTVDDSPVSVDSSGPILLDPGSHVVRARAEGYETAERTLNAEGGREQPVSLSLLPVAPPRAAEPESPLPAAPVVSAARPPYTQQKPVVGAVMAPIGVAGIAVGWVYYALRQNTRRQLSDVNAFGVQLGVSAYERDKFNTQGWASMAAAGVGVGVLALSEYFWLPDDPGVPAGAWVVGGFGVAVAAVGITYGAIGRICDVGDTFRSCQAFSADATFGPLIILHALPLLAVPLSYALRSAVRPLGVEVALSFTTPSLRDPGLSIAGRF